MTSARLENEMAFVRRILRHRTSVFLGELSALKRHSGSEAVHDTRVQSRRLRAALDAFRDLFEPAAWDAAYAAVALITRKLGKPRETGVMLSLVNELGSADSLADNLCREYLAERLRRKLTKQEKQLRKWLATASTREVGSKVRAIAAGTPRHAGSAGKRSQVDPRAALAARARRVLQESAAPVLAFKPSRPFRKTKDARLHALRISAKRLRYAMEIFDEIWPDGLRGRIALAKALQDAGGIFQDWCILCDKLKGEAKRLKKRRSRHLGAQVGLLLGRAKQRKAELKEMILPALTQFQTSLRTLAHGGSPVPAGGRASPGGGKGARK